MVLEVGKKASLAALLFLAVGAVAAEPSESEACTYNELKGRLVVRLAAHDSDKSRSWVPLDLRLCKNEEGTYAILSHRAVGLGVMANPPLKTESYKGLQKGDAKIVLLLNNQEDDRKALKALEAEDVEAVVVGGTSKTQLTVFRKELDRVYSNTLFKLGGK